jgi:hypothetical protein
MGITWTPFEETMLRLSGEVLRLDDPMLLEAIPEHVDIPNAYGHGAVRYNLRDGIRELTRYYMKATDERKDG